MQRNRKRPAEQAVLGPGSPPKCPKIDPFHDRLRKVNTRFKDFIQAADLESVYEQACTQYLEYVQHLRKFLGSTSEAAGQVKGQGGGGGKNGWGEHRQPRFAAEITGRFAHPPVNPVRAPLEIFRGVGADNGHPAVQDGEMRNGVEVQGSERESKDDPILPNTPKKRILEAAAKYAALGESSNLPGASCGLVRMETIPEEPEMQTPVVSVGIDKVPAQACEIKSEPKLLDSTDKCEAQRVAGAGDSAELSGTTEQGSDASDSPKQADNAEMKLEEQEEDIKFSPAPPGGDAVQDPLIVVDRESPLNISSNLVEETQGDKMIADSIRSPANQDESGRGPVMETDMEKQGEDSLDKPKPKPIPIVWGSHLHQAQEMEKSPENLQSKASGEGTLPFGTFATKPFSFGVQSSFPTPTGLEKTTGKTLFGGVKAFSATHDDDSPAKNGEHYGKLTLVGENSKQVEQKQTVELDHDGGFKPDGGREASFGMPQSSLGEQSIGGVNGNRVQQSIFGHHSFGIPKNSPAGWMPSEPKEESLINRGQKIQAHAQPVSVVSRSDAAQQPSNFLGATTRSSPMQQMLGKPLLFGGPQMEAFTSRNIHSPKRDVVVPIESQEAHSGPMFVIPSEFSTAASPVTGNKIGGATALDGANQFSVRKPFNPLDPIDSGNCSPVYAMPPPATPPAQPSFGFVAPANHTFGSPKKSSDAFGNTSAPATGDELLLEKPTVEVEDNEVWEIKFKTKCKLYKQVEKAWRQVGIGSLSVRMKKSDDGQRRGWMFCTTDSGSVLMCNPLYPDIQVLQQKIPKMLLTSGTFLERKVAGAPGDLKPTTVESWISAPALIEVATSEKAGMLKQAIDMHKL